MKTLLVVLFSLTALTGCTVKCRSNDLQAYNTFMRDCLSGNATQTAAFYCRGNASVLGLLECD